MYIKFHYICYKGKNNIKFGYAEGKIILKQISESLCEFPLSRIVKIKTLYAKDIDIYYKMVVQMLQNLTLSKKLLNTQFSLRLQES